MLYNGFVAAGPDGLRGRDWLTFVRNGGRGRATRDKNDPVRQDFKRLTTGPYVGVTFA